MLSAFSIASTFRRNGTAPSFALGKRPTKRTPISAAARCSEIGVLVPATRADALVYVPIHSCKNSRSAARNLSFGIGRHTCAYGVSSLREDEGSVAAANWVTFDVAPGFSQSYCWIAALSLQTGDHGCYRGLGREDVPDGVADLAEEFQTSI